MTPEPRHDSLVETDIAIVGMAGRFPGAPDVDELWRRVERGEDCLTDINVDDAIRAGVPRRIARSAEYVLRDGRLDAVDEFDREFFGIGARDAAVMDPQQRHFLECAWEALESAAWTPETFPGAIGVFGGVGMNTYLLHNLLTNADLVERLGWFLLRHTANDKDFLTTTLSYRLGLTGPSINVQTACSTSLVAVHLAVQSLLAFECDLALAGGVTIDVPHGVGYEYREGEILSPSGRCRAFDARSEGTVLTGGAAVVALRRLADAIDDGDPVLAVVKGSAVNNDGDRKVGYLAPSVDGHAEVVKEALTVSGVDPRSIGLLEAHGTGTAVGDPIEIAALTEAFRARTRDVGFCRIASTKPNIGHLDTAAGTASLVKVVQALRHRTLPPLANHTGVNPLLDLGTTPFVISATSTPWTGDGPRRAGVSSLGVGGTNAHVIVEEAPDLPPTPPARPGQILAVSGLDVGAVDGACERLASWFEHHPDANVADVAHTLNRGRRAMPVRRVVAVSDASEAPSTLRSSDRRRRPTARIGEAAPRVAFAFPGGGAQFPGMGSAIDDRFDMFAAVRREGAEIVRRLGGVDLDVLLAADGDDAALRRPSASLPAVFVTSVALARQFMAWGVEPDVMIGHSLGEYVAAHLADVLTFEDALSLVVTRSALIERASGDDAGMLVVPLPEHDIVPLLDDGLSLATVNADDECVVAGRSVAIDRLEHLLAGREIVCNRVPIVAAAHSSMLDPILDEFLAAVRSVRLVPPTRPYVSNVTGDWITADQAVDPRYWVDHLRRTVRFADGLRTALQPESTVVVEIGPGHTLSAYARRSGLALGAFGTMRHPDDDHDDDTRAALLGFAQLWTHGVDVDLDRFTGEHRRRLRLPTYAFQRERCWIEPGTTSAIGAIEHDADELTRIEALDDMTWRPIWREAAAPDASPPRRTWRVIGDRRATVIADELRRRGDVAIVASPRSANDELDAGEADSVVIVGADIDGSVAQRWLDDAVAHVRTIARHDRSRYVALTSGAFGVDAPARSPAEALATGVVAVGPREFPGLETAHVDLADSDALTRDLAKIVDDIVGADGAVVHRSGQRLRPDLTREPVLEQRSSGFRRGGAYLITGGLGAIGGAFARHLATEYDASLVLLSSEPLPSGPERQRILRDHALDHPDVRRLRALAHIESAGRKIELVVADLEDPEAVRQALDEAERRVGRLDGVIHAAGRIRDRLLETVDSDDLRAVVAAKALGALTLVEELERRSTALLVLVSSTSSHLAPAGQAAYVAANAVLDQLAGRHGDLRVVTLGMGIWADGGMAATAARRARLGLPEGTIPVDHPLLSERFDRPRGVVALSGRLDAGHHWVVDEHRTRDGVAVLPGTAHLELHLAAAALAGLGGNQISEVALFEPLIVPDDRPVTVRVVLEPMPDGRFSVQLDSDSGHGRSWTLHSASTLDTSTAVGSLDLDEIARRCPLDGADPIASLERHLRIGPRWLVDATASVGDGEAFGRIRLAGDVTAELDRWMLHPAVTDVAAGFGVLAASPSETGRLHVPVGYRRVLRLDALEPEIVVSAVRRSDPDDELVVVDIAVTDPRGRVLVRIDGLELRPLDAPMAVTAPSPTADTVRSPTGLLDLVDEFGVRADEGVALLERLVRSDHDHLVVSAVDIERLHELAEPVGDLDEEPSDAAPPITAGSMGVLEKLLALWSDLLGVDAIAPDDDFFDLGGHSLIAIRLMTAIKRELGVRLQLSTIFEAPTPGLLAELIRREHPDLESDASSDSGTAVSSSERRHLVAIHRSGDLPPFYVVHGAGGNVLFLSSLVRALGADRPVYGFQAHGVNEGEIPDRSIEAMAARYVDELRAHAPGPYLLGGYSGGGNVAAEMVNQLHSVGERVRHLVLFDTPPTDLRRGRTLPELGFLVGHARRHGLAAVKPYVRRRLLDSIRRIIPEREEQQHEHDVQDRALGYRDVGDLGFVNLFYYFSAVAAEYEMRTYDVDATLIKADFVWPVLPEDYGWSEHIGGELTIRTTPGDHHAMFYPENAPALAAVVREVLAGADRAGIDQAGD